MNNWLAWALPLVALGVWILSNLIKNAQDEARRRDMRPRANSDQAENSQRREMPQPRKIERQRPPVRQQPVVRPTPVQERPRPGRQSAPEPVRIARRAEMVTDQIVVGQLVEQEAPTVSRSNVSPTRRPNKSVQNMLALLKNKNTLATAFLLTEVFGKPRCKR